MFLYGTWLSKARIMIPNLVACMISPSNTCITSNTLDKSPFCRVDLSSSKEESIASDRYNSTCVSPSSSQYGYGLGHKNASREGTSMDMAAPLTPFAGVDRRAIVPSPDKASRSSKVFILPAIVASSKAAFFILYEYI